MRMGIGNNADKRCAGADRRAFGMLRRLGTKVLALALALLLVFACAATAFAKSADGLLTAAEKGSESTAPAGDTTTIGASEPTGQDTTGQENSASQDGSEEPDPELARRKEIYTFMTLIALGAIIVGIREKRSKRRY